MNDFDLVWSKDKFPTKILYNHIENSDLHEYTYSSRTLFLVINDEFYFIKGYLPIKDFSNTISNFDCRNQNPVEHFIQFEASVYYVLGLDSTVQYTKLITNLINIYKKKYNESPSIPEPVAVFKYNRFYQKQYKFNFSKLIRCRGCGTFNYRDFFETQVNNGIGFLVYKFPYFPHRVSTLRIDQNGLANYHIYNVLHPDKFIQGVTESFSKIINLGYIFTDYIHSGNCLQIQNLTTNGHFLDMDSVFYIKRKNLDLLEFNIYTLVKDLKIIGIGNDILDYLQDAIFIRNTARKKAIFLNIRNRLF